MCRKCKDHKEEFYSPVLELNFTRAEVEDSSTSAVEPASAPVEVTVAEEGEQNDIGDPTSELQAEDAGSEKTNEPKAAEQPQEVEEQGQTAAQPSDAPADASTQDTSSSTAATEQAGQPEIGRAHV